MEQFVNAVSLWRPGMFIHRLLCDVLQEGKMAVKV